MRPPLTIPLLRATRNAASPTRCFSTTTSRARLRVPLDIPPPFPVTQTCPEPSCSCPPTPELPEGLPIDYDQPLNGTMAAYTQQLLICTGQRDWTSRIEEDGQGQGWGDLARGLKKLMGRGGQYADPFNNVLVSNSSFPSSSTTATSTSTSPSASAFLFPSFKYFPSVPATPASPTPQPDLSTFVRGYLLPEKLSHFQSSLPESKQAELTRKPELSAEFPAIDVRHSPFVLICGHGGRDMRCGIMAPVLEETFRGVLGDKGFNASAINDGESIDTPDRAHVGLISHVGGHKYAGNVIVYIPPEMKVKVGGEQTLHPLAGMGIWYGRIEPKHVPGIVEETILRGRVVKDHFRGGIGREGDILRL